MAGGLDIGAGSGMAHFFVDIDGCLIYKEWMLL